MDRRQFLSAVSAVGAAVALPATRVMARAADRPAARIARLTFQRAKGRRLTPVAPNAYAPYRGYEVVEPLLRVRTAQGVEGFCTHHGAKPEVLKRLLGLDPFALFDWDGDVVRAPAAAHAELLSAIGGADVALLDLLGKLIGKPVASLLGKPVRETVAVYDSSLYMEDLLKPDERRELAYLKGQAQPADDAELVARKAAWLLEQPHGIRIFKIKTGRVKWMQSFDAALARDIAVVKAIRKAVGPDVVLFVDGNDGYKPRPIAAAEFAEATAADNVYAIEEMFPEGMVAEAKEVKRRCRAAGLKIKLTDGENLQDGVPFELLAERVDLPGGAAEPLFDIDQPDMNWAGYTRMAAVARECAKHKATVAPHNFGSKMGLFAQVHQGLVTPNWEFCETDDSQFPALRGDGIKIEKGHASLTGKPGLGVELDEQHLEKPEWVLEA